MGNKDYVMQGEPECDVKWCKFGVNIIQQFYL